MASFMSLLVLMSCWLRFTTPGACSRSQSNPRPFASPRCDRIKRKLLLNMYYRAHCPGTSLGQPLSC